MEKEIVEQIVKGIMLCEIEGNTPFEKWENARNLMKNCIRENEIIDVQKYSLLNFYQDTIYQIYKEQINDILFAKRNN